MTGAYMKPMDKHEYLCRDICNLIHYKASVPFSEVLRLRQICSDDCTYRNRTYQFEHYFSPRGYNKQHLEKEYKGCLILLKNSACNQNQNQRNLLVYLWWSLQYYPFLPSFHLITKHPLSILHTSEWLWEAFLHQPLIAFNDQGTWWISWFKWLWQLCHELPGNNPCGAPKCKMSHTYGHWWVL